MYSYYRTKYWNGWSVFILLSMDRIYWPLLSVKKLTPNWAKRWRLKIGGQVTDLLFKISWSLARSCYINVTKPCATLLTLKNFLHITQAAGNVLFITVWVIYFSTRLAHCSLHLQLKSLSLVGTGEYLTFCFITLLRLLISFCCFLFLGYI